MPRPRTFPQRADSATGLATLTQQVGITIGVPILGAVAATQAGLLDRIRLALVVNVVLTVAAVALIWNELRPRSRAGTSDTARSRAGQRSQSP